MKLLTSWLPSFNQSSRRSCKKTNREKPQKATKLSLEPLEDRLVPARLFVDFGDDFPGGTLTTTQGALRDVANSPTPADRILGPTVADSTGGFTPGTAVNIVKQAVTAADRARMMDLVRRAYLPLNVTVVELTGAAGAANMGEVVTTLRSGPAASRDAYVFVGTFIVAPGAANQRVYNGIGVGGDSPGSPVLGETSDLAAGSNVHDDVAMVYSSGGFSTTTLNNIAHEAGHLFGLRHAITSGSGSAAIDLFHQAEIMSYLNTSATTSSAFTRYPMIHGDGNSPGGSIGSYNDLAARNGQSTLYDQLSNDPNVGANPLYSFVSGTGAHEIITITRNGANADVTIQAFSYAAYTPPITGPGAGGTTYSYSFPIGTKTILIYAGGSNDRIVINGDLGVNVEIDGMIGTDELVVNGQGAVEATYTPNATAPAGADIDAAGVNVPSYGGTVTIGARTIKFKNFEPASFLTLGEFGKVTVAGTDDPDTFTAEYFVTGHTVVRGSVSASNTAVV